MSTFISGTTDYQFVKEIGTSLLGSGSGNIFNSFINSVFTEGENGTSTSNSNRNSDNTIKKLLEIVEEILLSRHNANKEVSESAKKIENARALSQKETNDATKKVSDYLCNINSNIKSINTTLENIKKMSGDKDGGMKDLEKQLQEKKDQITESIQKLRNNPNDTDALEDIKRYNEDIASLLTQVSTIAANIQKETENVKNYTVSISEAQKAANDLITDTTELVSGISLNAESQTAVNTAFETKGGEQVIQGETVIANAAVAEVATAGTGTAAVIEATEKASKHIANGKTYIKGGSENLIKLGSTLPQISANLTTIASFSQDIGSALGNADTAIGGYQTELNSTITSIGSWEPIKTANTNLEVAVSAYEGKFNQDNESAEKNKKLLLDFDPGQFELKTA